MSRAHGTQLNLQYDVSDRNGDNMASPLLSMEATESKTTRLGFIAGTILEDKKMSFERILFRATRGNMFLKVVRPDAAEGGRIVRLPCTLPLPPSCVRVCVWGGGGGGSRTELAIWRLKLMRDDLLTVATLTQ